MSALALKEINNLQQVFPVKSETVKDMIIKAQKNLAYASWSFEIFNRSHSDCAWDAFVLNNDSDTRNICQVSAELSQKRKALLEAKHKYYLYIAEADMLDEKADHCDPKFPAEKRYYHKQADEKRELAQTFNEPVLGCAKDINKLTDCYKQLEKNIKANHNGRFDEEIFEIEEREYWVKRLYRQSAREVRQYGKIQAGNQGALEDFGFDPIAVQEQINRYLNQRKQVIAKTKENCDVSSTDLDAWINAIGKAFSKSHDAKQVAKGFEPKILKDHLTLGQQK